MAKPKKTGGKGKAPAKKRGGGSKRPSRSKKDQVEVIVGGVQDLLPNLAPDKDALHAYETLLRLEADVSEARASVTKQKKIMEEQGLNVPAFKQAMKLEKMTPIDLANYLYEQRRLINLRGLPVQMELHGTSYASVGEQAKAEGRHCGRAGKSPDTSRYPEGTEGFDPYMAGWHEGQADLVHQNGGDKEDAESVH